MRSSPQQRRVPSLRDQLVEVERREHVAELAKVTEELEALHYQQRELVARILFEGGSWADVAQATGLSTRTARRRWSKAPPGSIGETSRAARAAEMRGSSGNHRPLQGC